MDSGCYPEAVVPWHGIEVWISGVSILQTEHISFRSTVPGISFPDVSVAVGHGRVSAKEELFS